MAQGIVANSPSKLNLSRRQTALFQKTILVGSRMADALKAIDKRSPLLKYEAKLVTKWGDLMVALVEMLL